MNDYPLASIRDENGKEIRVITEEQNFKNFTGFITSKGYLVQFCLELYKKKVLQHHRCEDGVNIDYRNMALLSAGGLVEFASRLKLGKSQLLLLHCITQAVAKGPKILKLEHVDYQAMAHTDLNLMVKDYNQPFETMIIEFPEKFSKEHSVKDPLMGTMTITGFREKEKHWPVFSIVHHDTEIEGIFVSVYLSSSDVWSFLIEKQDEDIETQMQLSRGQHYNLSLPVSSEEENVLMDVIRVSLNTCLFVDEYGLKKLGHGNPAHAKRLQHYVEVARKKKDQKRLIKAEQDLRLLPTYYSFEQKVHLYATESTEHQKREGGYTIDKVFWRHGHWRMQAHGPGNSLRKRIRIKPVLVNGDKFVGELKDTKVTYTD